jgi:hypothetical protein
MATYVIREKYFGYNDEVFYVAGNRIANVFDNKQQAEAAYKKLEINGARDFALYEVESLFDADEALLKKLDDFVFHAVVNTFIKTVRFLVILYLKV